MEDETLEVAPQHLSDTTHYGTSVSVWCICPPDLRNDKEELELQAEAVKRGITMVLVDSVTPDYVWAHKNKTSLCRLAPSTWWDDSHITASCLSHFKVWRQFQRSGVAVCIVYQATHGLCMDILLEEVNWVKSMEFGSMCFPLTRRKHMGWSTTCSWSMC